MMNKYIGTVKDSYMFTNRLSNITVGDILYNYDKLGERVHIDKWEDYPLYICWRADNGRGMMLDYVTQGTGKVNAKYRVVEVLPHYKKDKNGVSLMWNKQLNTYGFMGIRFIGREVVKKKFAIKLELIEQVDIELSELYNATRYEHYLTVKDNGLDMTSSDTFKFTKYNGLQKVIYIGDNK